MSSCLTEAIGTFVLVLTIGLTLLDGTPLAPLAAGSVLTGMVYMGGHISGAHYNPALSIAMLPRGKIAGGDTWTRKKNRARRGDRRVAARDAECGRFGALPIRSLYSLRHLAAVLTPAAHHGRRIWAMDISRRELLKLSALTGGSALVSTLGFDLKPAYAAARDLKVSNAREFKTVCPYCAVGCGAIAYVHGSGGLNTVNSIIHVEGDADSPINGGTLCPKGAAQMQLAQSPRLEKYPRYRAPGASEWTEVSWDWAMDWFARKFKDSRDATFVERDEQVARSTAAKASGGWAAPRWPTRMRTSSRRRCAPWASSTSITRPEYDTAPQWPVWPQRSGGAR